jgi:hypothetical protein
VPLPRRGFHQELGDGRGHGSFRLRGESCVGPLLPPEPGGLLVSPRKAALWWRPEAVGFGPARYQTSHRAPGKRWPTSEHYFHAQKFDDPKVRERILA